jgi:hypothetical protein
MCRNDGASADYAPDAMVRSSPASARIEHGGQIVSWYAK